MKHVATIALGLIFFSQPAVAGLILPPTTFRVGADASCDFSTIQDAVDAAIGGDFIRINQGTFTDVDVVVSSEALNISGGWESCAASSRAPGSMSTVQASSNHTALTISGAAGQEVDITGLEIVDSGGFLVGGGMHISGDVEVNLAESVLIDHSAFSGGAISLSDGALLRLEAVNIEGNQAIDGAGIHCVNAEIEISSVRFWQNEATGRGGAIFADNCVVASTTPLPSATEDIVIRSLAEMGGGIFARNGSEVTLQAARNRRLLIQNNTAESGGAFYLEGASTEVFLDGATVTHNGGINGAAVARVLDGALLDMDRGSANGDNCYDMALCSLVQNNFSNAHPVFGLFDDGEIDIRQTVMDDNGRLFRIQGGGAQLFLESVVITNHTSVGVSAIQVVDGAEGHLTHVTSHGNVGGSPLIFTDAASVLELINSLFWEDEIPILSGPADVVQCVSASDATVLGATLGFDPGFLDVSLADGLGLDLRLDSENVDACVVEAGLRDVLGRSRNVAFLSPLLLSDRGAFEVQDLLFADGF